MAIIPDILKNGLSADTIYPTDSIKTIVKKMENNHYIVSMLNGGKTLKEIYLEAKEKEALKKQQIIEEPKEEKIIHDFF